MDTGEGRRVLDNVGIPHPYGLAKLGNTVTKA